MAARVVIDIEKRSETLVSLFFKLCHQCLSICVQHLLLQSSHLYLNQGRAKLKRDFHTRGR
jgi:hypothetical protein